MARIVPAPGKEVVELFEWVVSKNNPTYTGILAARDFTKDQTVPDPAFDAMVEEFLKETGQTVTLE
jgi:hypothetical protein